jgi:O-antigen/teichoic acid export membrane protein
MVQMGEALQQRRPERARALWHDAVARLGSIFFPLTALLLVVGHELIVTLFTASYAASVPLFRLASLAVPLLALQTDAVLRVLAEMRFLFGLNVLRLAVVAALIVPFLSRFQLAGAVWVTLIAGLVAKAVALVRIARLQRLGVPAVLPWRRLATAVAASAGAGLLAISLRAALGWPPLPRLVAVSVAFVVGYALLGRVAGVLPRLAPGAWIAWLRGAPIPAREP